MFEGQFVVYVISGRSFVELVDDPSRYGGDLMDDIRAHLQQNELVNEDSFLKHLPLHCHVHQEPTVRVRGKSFIKQESMFDPEHSVS